MNPRKGCPFKRFRGLRMTVQHESLASLNCADTPIVFTRERLRTEVNETRTEPASAPCR